MTTSPLQRMLVLLFVLILGCSHVPVIYGFSSHSHYHHQHSLASVTPTTTTTPWRRQSPAEWKQLRKEAPFRSTTTTMFGQPWKRRDMVSSMRLHATNDSAADNTNKKPPSVSSSSSSISTPASLTRDFFAIGAPALLQLAAEPLAALVDTAYLGRLGPHVLGGAGVAISAQYAVSKLYNDPLLRTSISLVAAQDGSRRLSTDSNTSSDDSNNNSDNKQADATADADALSIAVSSALWLAAVVGVVQMIVYTLLGSTICHGMGLTPASDMWPSAVSYLQIRALGTPAATLWLVTNGIFRGLGDTQTPLCYALAFTAGNALLDPLFIFGLGWGASGAAAGTALAQYAALGPLLYALHKKVPIRVWGQFGKLKSTLRQYLSAGGWVLVRTVGKVLAYSVCARQAALLGSVAAAAYNLTFQLGFATTQICEAVAVAVQTLLARERAAGQARLERLESSASSGGSETETVMVEAQAQTASLLRHLVTTSVWLGGGVASVLSLVTYLRRDWILSGLTSSPAIRAAATEIFPVVLLTQILKGLAYPVNGILMGGLDWVYSMLSMWLANAVCVGMVFYFGAHNASSVCTLTQLWWALAAFMGTQVVAGIVRYESKTGVWKLLRNPKRTVA